MTINENECRDSVDTNGPLPEKTIKPTKTSEEAVKFRYRIKYNDGSRQIKNQNRGQGKFSRAKRFDFTVAISPLHLLTQNQFTVFST